MTNVLALPRPDLKKRIIDSPEVLQVIKQIPHLSTLVESLYNCEYSVYFASLLGDREGALRRPLLLAAHALCDSRAPRFSVHAVPRRVQDRYFVLDGGLRRLGQFIDGELARFISCGRLNAKVDKVDNVVHTTRADLKSKNARRSSSRATCPQTASSSAACRVDLTYIVFLSAWCWGAWPRTTAVVSISSEGTRGAVGARPFGASRAASAPQLLISLARGLPPIAGTGTVHAYASATRRRRRSHYAVRRRVRLSARLQLRRAPQKFCVW